MAVFAYHLVVAAVKSPLKNLELWVECHQIVRSMELVRRSQQGFLERADWGWSLAEGWMEVEEGGADSVRDSECPALKAEGTQFAQHMDIP